MATIKAFRALRPDRKLVEDIVSKPYDVVNLSEARVEAKKSPLSFMRVVRSEVDFPEEVNPYSDEVYQKAKQNLDNLVSKKALIEDSNEYLYVYAQTMNKHTQYGLVVASLVDDYVNNLIKKHEKTRKQKEDDRYRHVRITEANTGPVFLTYKDRAEIKNIIKSVVKQDAEYDFIRDGVRHQFWVIKEKDIIKQLVKEFEKIDSLYVADGHHRSASAARVAVDMAKENPKHTGKEEYNYFLSVIFPASELNIMAYNRVLNVSFNKEELLKKLEESFNVGTVSYKEPKQKGEILVYIDFQWYSLTLKDDKAQGLEIVDSLDVAILQNYILEPIFDVKDPRTDDRINFIGGIRGITPLENAVNSGQATIAFSMFPTSIEELMAVSDENLLMPPKSTWFEPKLLSGLVVHKII